MLLVSWLNLDVVEKPTTTTTEPQMPEDDNDNDSWQVRAFEEDTNNLLGCTWPPRAYTCTFCRREFRSAQALGGHMNVHRRDRARLHEPPPQPAVANYKAPPRAVFIPTQELIANGLCLLYSLPNPNGFVINPGLLPAAAAPRNNERGLKDSAAVEEEVDLELRLGRK